MVQSLLYFAAKRPDGTGQSCKFFLPIRMCIQLPCLFFKLMLTLFEIILAPPVFIDEYDADKVGFRQALDLLCQARLTSP